MAATNLYVTFKQVLSRQGSNAVLFERKDRNDLWYHHHVSLYEAIECKPVKIQTLDGKTLLISLDQIPSPNSVK